MRIVLFNSERDWGGGEKWYLDSTILLRQHGHEVIPFVHRDGKLKERFQKCNIPFWDIQIGNLSFLNPFKIHLLSRTFRKLQPDAVLFNLPSDLKAGGIAAFRAGVSRIVYRRGSAKPIKDSFLNRYLFRKIVTSVIANSYETRRTILANNPGLMDPSNIHVVYNGIQSEEYGPAREKSAQQTFVIGTAGRLSPEKGHSRLLDVMKILKDKGLGFQLRIAGTGPEEDALKQKAEKLGLSDCVFFEGFVYAFSSFLKELDIFVLPSYYEGFGYVLIEAMEAEKPVIAFDTGSSKEIIEEGKNGFIIPENNKEAMAHKILLLAKEPGRRREFGKYGRERVEEKFSFDTMYRNLMQVLTGKISKNEQ